MSHARQARADRLPRLVTLAFLGLLAGRPGWAQPRAVPAVAAPVSSLPEASLGAALSSTPGLPGLGLPASSLAAPGASLPSVGSAPRLAPSPEAAATASPAAASLGQAAPKASEAALPRGIARSAAPAPAPRTLPLPPAPEAVAAPALAARADPQAAPAAAPRDERAAVALSVWTAAETLAASKPHAAFAREGGLRVVVAPFRGNELLGLDPDNLAQLEYEDRLLYLNWDLIAPDRERLRAALPPAEADALLALALAPVFAHEVRHAMLRSGYGAQFPGLREEEILTHADQAAVFDEAVRTHPLVGRVDTFLFRHTRPVWERWRRGFGPLAEFVLRKYSGQPSLQDAAADNAARARRDRELLAGDPDLPPVWRGRLDLAVRIWEDEGQVRRLTAHLQGEIDALHAAFRR